MKTFLCWSVAFLFFGKIVYAQTTVAKDSLYIVTYTTGEAWDHAKAPGDQVHFKDHSSRLSQLRKDGVIRIIRHKDTGTLYTEVNTREKFGARYADKGIIVITAANFAVAKEIVSKDVAVATKLFQADVQKLGIFYEGCLEKIK